MRTTLSLANFYSPNSAGERGTTIGYLGSSSLAYSPYDSKKLNLPMYKVYETCKANETPSGRFVRVDRVAALC